MQLKKSLKRLSWPCASKPIAGSRLSWKSGIWDTILALTSEATVQHRPACLHTNYILIGDCFAPSIYCCQGIWETWKSADLRCFSQDPMPWSRETSTGTVAKSAIVHANFGPLLMFWCAATLACLLQGTAHIQHY